MAPDLVPKDVKAQRDAERCEDAGEDADSEAASEAEVGAVRKMRKEGLKEALLKFAAKKKWKPPDEEKLDEAVDDHLVREKPLRQVFMDVFPLSTREQDEEQDEELAGWAKEKQSRCCGAGESAACDIGGAGGTCAPFLPGRWKGSCTTFAFRVLYVAEFLGGQGWTSQVA